MSEKKILVVDDEKDLVDLVKIRLEANKYEVVTAYNGKEGIKKAKDDKPDLILLDIMMPEMDGFMVIKELRKKEITKNIPIIIVTAKDKMKGLFEPEGIVDYVVKPFTSDEILLRIKDIFEE